MLSPHQGGPVVVIDNGSGCIKAGIGGERAPRSIFPHCSAKSKGEKQTLIGDAIVESNAISQLTIRRPHERGYLVNNDLEREIWGRLFRSSLKINPRECSGLLITEPIFNFPQVQATTEQIVFEEFGFPSFHAAPAPVFSMRRAADLRPGLPATLAGAGVVVDAGFSFTHAVPFFDGQPLLSATKRINIGGKALTNYLKELVSYRSLNMMDETYLMEQIKDQLCFVSQDLRADLRLSKPLGYRSPCFKEFVLPDGVNNLRGYVKDPPEPGAPRPPANSKQQEQVLQLNNERFLVPEVLFNPSDIGLNQCGIAEAVVQAVESTHPALAPLLYSNVVLTGAVVACPGFSSRFLTELRPMVPADIDLDVFTPPEPALMAWEGMSLFAASGQYASCALTKREYEEHGAARKQLQQANRRDY